MKTENTLFRLRTHFYEGGEIQKTGKLLARQLKQRENNVLFLLLKREVSSSKEISTVFQLYFIKMYTQYPSTSNHEQRELEGFLSRKYLPVKTPQQAEFLKSGYIDY